MPDSALVAALVLVVDAPVPVVAAVLAVDLAWLAVPARLVRVLVAV